MIVMKKNIDSFVSEVRGRKGVAAFTVALLAGLMAVLAFSLYNYMFFERNLVAHLEFSSVIDKMARSAALEAAGWYNCKAINIRALLSKKSGGASDAEKFVLAAMTEKEIEGRNAYFSEKELKSFGLIKKWGGELKSVELKYTGFKCFFKDNPSGDLKTGCYVPADPFERVGGLLISAKVKYRGLIRVFCCRYEVKVANTLLPVVSKFTLFSREKKGDEGENQLEMRGRNSQPDKSVGPQGIVRVSNDPKSPQVVPLVLVHHPDDVAVVNGYGANHAKIREFMPPGETAQASSTLAYRPQMHNRGWVYLGSPGGRYVINITPGNVNPSLSSPYKSELSYSFYGNGFMMLESDIYALAKSDLKGNYPYQHSFRDVETPGEIKDYIVRILHSGIYWLGRSETSKRHKYIFGNYYKDKPDRPDLSSLIGMCGDMQPLAFSSPEMPSRYLDRRSPTVVFGTVYRSFFQIGTLSQNCIHPSGSKGEVMMMQDVHKQPFALCLEPMHPMVTILPYFNIDDKGELGKNEVLKFNDPSWKDFALIYDKGLVNLAVNNYLGVQGNAMALAVAANGGGAQSGGGDDDDQQEGGNAASSMTGITGGKANEKEGKKHYAEENYDVRKQVFGLDLESPKSENLSTYKVFMSKVVTEPFNKSYNWIIANSSPKDGIMEPAGKCVLRREDVEILDSLSGQTNEEFFYSSSGGCSTAGDLAIYQYDAVSRKRDKRFFPEGMFKGALGALALSTPNFINPLKNVPDKNALDEYDIRYKASFVFDNFAEFAKCFIDRPASSPASAHIKEGGVFYIDGGDSTDLTDGGKISNIVFYQSAMIICRGGVRVPNVSKSPYAKANGCTLTIVSCEGDIVIAGTEIEASLNALTGRAVKTSDYFQIFGNLTVKALDFDTKKPDNLFRVSELSDKMKPFIASRYSAGGEAAAYERLSVAYDPALDPFDAENYTSHYKLYVASKQTYWKVSTAGE